MWAFMLRELSCRPETEKHSKGDQAENNDEENDSAKRQGNKALIKSGRASLFGFFFHFFLPTSCATRMKR
ncbi:MAG: hypothetical protein D6790_13620, partial [Caldilineae bacterium]